jgi:hypothetical protein
MSNDGQEDSECVTVLVGPESVLKVLLNDAGQVCFENIQPLPPAMKLADWTGATTQAWKIKHWRLSPFHECLQDEIDAEKLTWDQEHDATTMMMLRIHTPQLLSGLLTILAELFPEAKITGFFSPTCDRRSVAIGKFSQGKLASSQLIEDQTIAEAMWEETLPEVGRLLCAFVN